MRDEIIVGRDPVSNRCLQVRLEGDRIASIEPSNEACDLWISAGLIDLQVNGYAGFDFNGPGCTVESVFGVVDALSATGVTCLAPTVITASEASMTRSLRVVAEARRQYPRAAACIPLIHVEGPHISPLDGYRGAHPQEHIRPPSLDEFERWQLASGGLVGMVTLSPHFEGAAAYISELTARGVQVSLGHTHASHEQIQRAVDAGAYLSTHLGNGIAASLPRHPNPIWSQLSQDSLTASFIADGHHLPGETLKAMMRAKGLSRSFLVSDSVALAGMPAGHYTTPVGGLVELSQDGKLVLQGSSALAGATIPLAQCIGKAVRMTGFPLSDILRMATEIPGSLVGDRGLLQVGSCADIIRFRWTDEIVVEDVWLAGERLDGARHQPHAAH
jgi:N-acetylglucosamine-6-phosphate deacetylase